LALSPLQMRADSDRSFSISTNRTYAPGEKPSIHLYAQNEDMLEFRVYHVDDPATFFSQLDDLHSFSPDEHRGGPAEKIDQPTLLERFHDWKHRIWFLIRQFFRSQVSHHTRDSLRHEQAMLSRRDNIVGMAEFAQVPLLNDKQLVARWRQTMPPTFVSDSQDLPIDPLPAGLYLVEATDAHYKAYTLLMVSQMVLLTRTGTGTAIAYTADRKTGEPIPDVQITVGVGHQQVAGGQTDKDGTLDLKTISDMQGDNLWLLATRGSDVAAVTPWSWSFTQTDNDRYAAYIYTDRPIYRPGHTVHWKAILRQKVQNHLEVPPAGNVHVRITDDENKTLLDKQVPLSSMGTLNGDLVLASDADLGYYQISMAEMNSGGFQVQEYRKPDYQVMVQTDKPRVLEGNKIQATIDSRYFFGEPVANAKVKYRVYHSAHYWWGDEQDDTSGISDVGMSADGSAGDIDDVDTGYDDQPESEQVGKLDANGKLTITVPTRVDDKQKNDYDYTVEAAVTDDADHEITGKGHFLATYGSFHVHVEPASYMMLPGQPAVLNITATDYDNMPVKTKVHLEAHSRRYQNGDSTDTQLGTWDVMTDAQGRAQLSAAATNTGGGEVEFTPSAQTTEGRTVQDTAYVWMLTNQQANSWDMDNIDTSQMLQIVADKKIYAPGDTAHLCLIAQTTGFYALVTASGSSLAYKQVLHSDGRTLNFDVPIDADSQPNLTVNAIVLSDGQLYRADKRLKVPPLEKQLQVTITPSADTFQPQQTVSYDVSVVDWQQKPVSAELSFGAVDEAIYSIQPDESGDIVNALYPQRGGYFDVESSLTYDFSGEAGLKSPLLAKRRSGFNPRMAQVKPGQDLVQPRILKAFPDTAFWAPTLHTDANGHARVQFAFPDSLTTWRVTVRAITADSEGGSAINQIVVRKNIIVRLDTPRFMQKNDEITLPLIVHNYTEQPKTVTVSLGVTGLEILAGQTQQIFVPSRSDATAEWRLKATQLGTATLTAKALTTLESDALEVSFPVEPIGVPENPPTSSVVSDSPQDEVTQ
jgi:uncharacterized protein YfaS (alpha-2-macroglobulin family)